MFKYIRRKIGEAYFTHTDSFDDAEKAADPQAIGEFVEVKVNDIKVKKEKDDRAKDSSAKVQGSPREETQKVSGDKGTS
jgi:hypothetical protein